MPCLPLCRVDGTYHADNCPEAQVTMICVPVCCDADVEDLLPEGATLAEPGRYRLERGLTQDEVDELRERLSLRLISILVVED